MKQTVDGFYGTGEIHGVENAAISKTTTQGSPVPVSDRVMAHLSTPEFVIGLSSSIGWWSTGENNASEQ